MSCCATRNTARSTCWPLNNLCAICSWVTNAAFRASIVTDSRCSSRAVPRTSSTTPRSPSTVATAAVNNNTNMIVNARDHSRRKLHRLPTGSATSSAADITTPLPVPASETGLTHPVVRTPQD